VSFAEILILALALALDAIAVAAARGLGAPKVRVRDALVIGLLFGGFQAGMPAIGYALGAGFGKYAQAWDHWIAFALLAFVGLNMVRGAIKANEAGDEEGDAVAADDAFAVMKLLPLALATSIDALAAGVSLPMAGAPLPLSVATIGVVTFVTSGVATLAARKLGSALGDTVEKRLGLIAGVVLCLLAVKVPIDHIRAGI
jgi:putative Mn2+ efflux pump MntP